MKNYIGVIGRAFTIFIRLFVPVSILYLSGQEELGKYYLVLSVISFSLFALTFEAGYFFSKKHIRANNRINIGYWIIRIAIVQSILVVILTIPLFIIFFYYSNIFTMGLILASILYVFTESISNEFGRFLDNINHVNKIIYRDLYRGASLLISILTTLYVFRVVVIPEFFMLSSIFNIGLIIYEYRKNSDKGKFPFKLLRFSTIIKIPFTIFHGSKEVISQSWILYLYPILERLVIGKSFGLEVIAQYVFAISIFQAITSILFLPSISRLRSCSVELNLRPLNSNNKVLGFRKFLMRIIIFGILMTLIIYCSKNYINELPIANKLQIPIIFIFTSMTYVFSNTAINILSPIYVRVYGVFKASIFTIGVYFIALLVFSLGYYMLESKNDYLFLILSIGFLYQIYIRREFM